MNSIIRRSTTSLLILVSVIILTACHKPPPAATGPHPLTPYQQSLVSEIRASGAQVIKQGERLQIVMPTDRFFRLQTVHLRRHKMPTMDRIATLVRSYASFYRKPRILVAGYTDTVFDRQTRKVLSLQYARIVASYLWGRGVPHRLARVRGYAARQPIASNKTVKGSAYNRRVVIRIN